MVSRVPNPPTDKDSRIRTPEQLMAAPTGDGLDTLLEERGAMLRQIGRRRSLPLAELVAKLREGK